MTNAAPAPKLVVYLDESGTQAGAPVLSVGGWMAREDAWAAFTAEWQQAMTDYGIDHFHMTTFENRKGPFANWPNHRRIWRLKRLMTIITRHAIASAGMSIDRVAYDRIVSRAMQKQVRGPYGLAVKSCLASFKRLSKDLGWTDPLSIVFAKGADQDSAIEQEVLRAIRENESDGQYLDVRFEAKTQVEPLQAADIAVYEMCKEMARILGYHERERRKLMSRVEERYKHWGYMDDEELTRFMEKNAHLLTGPATGAGKDGNV